MTLNARQIRFVDEYFVDFIGYKAAIRAGYKESNANKQSSDLLANPEVQALIAERKAAQLADLETIVERLTKLLAFDLTQYATTNEAGWVQYDIEKIRADGYGNLVDEIYNTSVGIRLKMVSKEKALDLLLRYYDKDTRGTATDPIRIEWVDADNSIS